MALDELLRHGLDVVSLSGAGLLFLSRIASLGNGTQSRARQLAGAGKIDGRIAAEGELHG